MMCTTVSADCDADDPTSVGIYFGQDLDGQVFVEALLPGGSASLARAVKPDDILLKLGNV